MRLCKCHTAEPCWVIRPDRIEQILQLRSNFQQRHPNNSLSRPNTAAELLGTRTGRRADERTNRAAVQQDGRTTHRQKEEGCSGTGRRLPGLRVRATSPASRHPCVQHATLHRRPSRRRRGSGCCRWSVRSVVCVHAWSRMLGGWAAPRGVRACALGACEWQHGLHITS